MYNLEDAIKKYIKQINSVLDSGEATELSYRTALHNFLEELLPNHTINHEAKRVENNAPDYTIYQNELPIAHVETKNLNDNLNSSTFEEQFDKYKEAFDTVIFTNYIEFEIWKNGELDEIIAPLALVKEKSKRRIIENSDKVSDFIKLANKISAFKPTKIRSAKKLAKIMAAQAKLLENAILEALHQDLRNNNTQSYIVPLFKNFKKILIHDLDEKLFADIYSQSITYGLFISRLSFDDAKEESFNLDNAVRYIPKTNPLLRSMFDEITGINMDYRIKQLVNAQVEMFSAVEKDRILASFNNRGRKDPLIHFYEDFLKEYDFETKKKMGVWYTPEPIVNFMVETVDIILESKFGLKNGLANDEYIEIRKLRQRSTKSEKMYNHERISKIQILDPATGTGTFLSSLIRQIYTKFQGNEGLWDTYVSESLLNRFYAFEYLMAPYVIANFKIGLQIHQTLVDKNTETNGRYPIYLTNTLEEAEDDVENLFSSKWLTDETKYANSVKNEKPIMVVIGNPPYNEKSANQSKYIKKLMESYKDGLNERNPRLDNDYIKFIRWAENLVAEEVRQYNWNDQTNKHQKRKESVVAFITPNTFLEGKTQRIMRKHLAQSFNDIYIVNLHGSNKSGETKMGDENVFGIESGVCITFFVKTSEEKKELANVYYTSLFGKKKIEKFNWLRENKFDNIEWESINLEKPNYYYTNVFGDEQRYPDDYLEITEIFNSNVSGFQTKNDNIAILKSEKDAHELLDDWKNKELTNEDIIDKYEHANKNGEWNLKIARRDLNDNNPKVVEIDYRPLDKRYTFFTGEKGFIIRPRKDYFSSMINNDNFAIVTHKENPQKRHTSFTNVTVNNNMVDNNYLQPRGGGYIFPMYMQVDDIRISNISSMFIKRIKKNIKKNYEERYSYSSDIGVFTTKDLMAYILGILFSEEYRKRYEKQLQKNYPKIPTNIDGNLFNKFVDYGKEIIDILIGRFSGNELNSTRFPAPGNTYVDRYKFRDNKVFINEVQVVEGISKEDFEFYLGGYQPLKQFLKVRKNSNLNMEEINNYRKAAEQIKFLRACMERMKSDKDVQNFFT